MTHVLGHADNLLHAALAVGLLESPIFHVSLATITRIAASQLAKEANTKLHCQ